MLTAFLRALGQVLDPPSRSVVWRGVGGAVGIFVVLWIGVGFGLSNLNLTAIPWLDGAIDVLGGVAVFAISWMLFPAAVIAISGLFIDAVVNRAEARYYPGLPAPQQLPVRDEVLAGLRLFGAALTLNLLALPLYVFLPGVNLPLFLAVNGWLAGREYFDLVAHRRLDVADAALLRHRHSLRVFAAGVVVVGLSTVPGVNLLVPVIAGAFFVHVFHSVVGTRSDREKSVSI